jgi:hypothetical protein
MQYLVALFLAGAAAWLISIIGAGAIERAISAFAQLVGGWRPDGWPRGVQEEDRDRPWAWLANVFGPPAPLPPPKASLEDTSSSAPTTSLRSHTVAR